MAKNIDIVWRRYEDIEVGDIVGPPTGANFDAGTGWSVVKAVRSASSGIRVYDPDVQEYVVPDHIELVVGYIYYDFNHRVEEKKLTGSPLQLIQVQVENFS